MPLDPGQFRSRIAELGADGHTPSTAWHDYLTTDQTALQETYDPIESAELTGSGAEPEPYPGPISLDGLTQTVELKPTEHALHLAALMGAYDTNVVEAAVAFEHLCSPTRGTSMGANGMVIDWTLDGVSTARIRPVYQRETTISWAANNSRVTAAINYVAERLDLVADGAIQTGTPPVTPHIQGLPTAAEAAAADPVLYLQCTDATLAPVSVVVNAKLGAAAAYAGVNQTLVAGQRLRLLDPTSARIGTVGAYLEAIIEDVSGLTSLDEWTFDLTRGVWTRALPVQAVLASPMVQVRVDGGTYRVTQGSVTITNPVSVNPTSGSRFADGAISNVGTRTVRWNLQSIAADASGIQTLRAAQSAEIEANLESGLIIPGGALNTYYGIDLISKNCLPTSGSSPGAISADSVSDTIVFSAHESTDPTYPDPLTIRIVNDIADLSA